MNPLFLATQAKGTLGMLRRGQMISRRYGLTPGKMERAIARFAQILAEFEHGATFPITAAAVARSNGLLERFQAQNIEFAVHGFYHVDHTRIPLEEQVFCLTLARRLFEERGISCQGFRCPYLRWNQVTVQAVRQCGFLYDSSQALAWEVVGSLETESYRRALCFYGALKASEYPALPKLDDGLVRIPYSLPDDEALCDRLGFGQDEKTEMPWLAILRQTYELGELFVLGLHPERIDLCAPQLTETLRHARTLSPGVWLARLDEVARWWMALAKAVVTAHQGDGEELLITVKGPEGVTVLARQLEVLGPTERWAGQYRIVRSSCFRVRAAQRPFIGVSLSSSAHLIDFLRQQGYIVEQTTSPLSHSFFVDRAEFEDKDERPLLAEIEQSNTPLIRLGRWPYGLRSALCITGDIDALTVWDYGLRFFGR